MAMTPDLSIIFPIYNEADNINYLVSQLDLFFSDNKEIRTEIIFVDDGSTDNSVNFLLKHDFKFFSVKIVQLTRNYGSHAAVRAGLLNASGERISIYAADLQDPLSLIIKMYNSCLSGYDIVIAQRRKVKEGISIKIFSRFYSYLMRKFAIKDYPPNGADVVMFNKKIKEILNDNIEANSNYVLQILSIGFKKTFIEYDKTERKFGKSKWTVSKKSKLFIDSFVAFSIFPIRLVSIVGILLFIVGFVWALYLVLRTLILNDLAQGWPTLISLLLIGFGITNIGLGIIAEYLWRTLDISRRRPVFVIDKIIELNKRD
jgi:dolichol-phosphate mannosyltransferase